MKMAVISGEQVAWVPDDAQIGERLFCLLIDPDCFETEVIGTVLESID